MLGEEAEVVRIARRTGCGSEAGSVGAWPRRSRAEASERSEALHLRLRRRASILVGAIVFGAIGCADVSFKPGASPDQIRRDEIACREAAGGVEADYQSCMKDRGYLVSKSGEEPGWKPAGR